MSRDEANVIEMARRVVATPSDQPALLADRINDLDVALAEMDRAPRRYDGDEFSVYSPGYRAAFLEFFGLGDE